MTSSRYLFCALLASALAIAPLGCRGGKKDQASTSRIDPVPQPEESWTNQQIAVPGAPDRPVKQGRPAPLVYMVESATMVRVADLTSGEDLLRMPVAAHTLVAVDANAGIRIGGATMKLGPLPSDHTYGIFLESTQTNIYRRGRIRPGQPAPQNPLGVPTTQPEVAP